jgi:catechol 2,3-dioxygenase-like lactoylglutathione lyase family enzyme
MPIEKLAHFSIRTTDLEASKRFYTQILGFQEGYRPPFDFPGAWLYRGGDEAEYGVVHIIGIDPHDSSGLVDYLGDKAQSALQGSAAIDHLAFFASDLPEMYRRFESAALPFRERIVPSLGLHQVFIEDPSGVTIELNFSADEGKAAAQARSVISPNVRAQSSKGLQ